MSPEIVGLLIVVGVVGIWIIVLGFSEGSEPTFENRPQGWDSTDDGRYWNAEAEKVRREQLVRAREVAKSWGQTIAGLLAVFGTVAFVKGPDSIDKVPGDDAYAVITLIAFAAATAALAVYFAAVAAQGTPKQIESFDGWRLKKLTEEQAPIAAKKLRASRALALVAALSLLAAMGAAWLASLGARDGEPEAEALVVVTEGEPPLLCGTLARKGTTLVLKTADGEVDLESVVELIGVESCPK